jgi:hypothetical protein
MLSTLLLAPTSGSTPATHTKCASRTNAAHHGAWAPTLLPRAKLEVTPLKPPPIATLCTAASQDRRRAARGAIHTRPGNHGHGGIQRSGKPTRSRRFWATYRNCAAQPPAPAFTAQGICEAVLSFPEDLWILLHFSYMWRSRARC